MPNPKVGTVTMDVTAAVKAASKGGCGRVPRREGRHHPRRRRQGLVRADKLARTSRPSSDAVSKAKPAGAKGNLRQARVAISSTMGPGVKIEPNTVLGG
jgi:large subunit ribosomal protein L1